MHLICHRPMFHYHLGCPAQHSGILDASGDVFTGVENVTIWNPLCRKATEFLRSKAGETFWIARKNNALTRWRRKSKARKKDLLEGLSSISLKLSANLMPKSNHPNVPLFKFISIRYQELCLVCIHRYLGQSDAIVCNFKSSTFSDCFFAVI